MNALGRDDIDVLVKLRVTGAERIWGVRQEHVFYALWWDPTHGVYPMNIYDN